MKVRIWGLFALVLVALLYAGTSDHRVWWMAATWVIGVITGILLSTLSEEQAKQKEG
jgi:membrane protein implicated in regulation of membrane protease activity